MIKLRYEFPIHKQRIMRAIERSVTKLPVVDIPRDRLDLSTIGIEVEFVIMVKIVVSSSEDIIQTNKVSVTTLIYVPVRETVKLQR